MASILTPHYAITPAFWSVERYFAASLGACWLAPTCSHSFTIRDEVGFFKVVRDSCGKRSRLRQKREAHLDTATHQLVSKVIEALGVVDLFAAMGLKTPDLSILSDYDALETNDSVVQVQGCEQLRTIARELVKAVRANVTIDGRCGRT